jgi:1,4-alpha-glucan branching enzyme
MLMMKITKKSKKTLVDVEAVAPEPVKPAPIKPALPVVAQPVKPAAHTLAQPVAAKPDSQQPARVALQLVEPAAKQVYVAGSFNGWKPDSTPLVPLGNGRWKGDLKLGPGRHEYLFVVDGHWRPDPSAKESVQNPFGGRNSVLTVSE